MGRSCCGLTAYVRPAIFSAVVDKRLVRERDLWRKMDEGGCKRHDILCISACSSLLMVLVEDRTNCPKSGVSCSLLLSQQYH